MPTVSLIVPCYNSSKFLLQTVDSVLKQDYSDWELILVDDGSKDNTWEIICQCMSADSRIHGFKKDNGGTTKSRNYGFSKVSPSSTYLFFLDHDDMLEPNALTWLSTYMNQHTEIGLLGCRFRDIAEDGRSLPTGKWGRWAPSLFFPRKLRDDEYDTPFVTFFCATGQGPFAMYRKSIFEQTDGWETDFWPHEDTDMFCQMALLAKVQFLPDILYIKRVHSAQGMSDDSRVQRSYQGFRQKWDNRQPKNDNEAIILKKATTYYYTTHRPFRSLKTAKKAFVELLSDPNLRRLRWFGQIISSAVKDLIWHRLTHPKINT